MDQTDKTQLSWCLLSKGQGYSLHAGKRKEGNADIRNHKSLKGGRLPGRGIEEAYLKEEETWCGSEIGDVGPSGQQVGQEQ